ncbi:MAG: XrtA-associated tyrosine autokinase [Proteobacteria bacterium]|nr:XrtA-associated tyrosine autokinase [Pseudomonadota bacterium]
MSIIEKALEKAKENKTNERQNLENIDVQHEKYLDAFPLVQETVDILQQKTVISDMGDVESKGFEKQRGNVERQPERTRNFLSINWTSMQERGMLTPEMARSQMAEEYRIIKRPLLMNAFPDGDNGIEHANLILVTSSVPGEGKTFTAANLALSIAMEREKWVLLVDADVAKPSVSKLLGIKPQAGLIDMLIGSGLRLSDMLIKTDIPNLSILPAGALHQHSTELLASDAMKRLAKELSERYPDRIVIFDSPPLLAATQAPVLANLMGQVVLVVEAEVTPQYIVQESIAKLESCKVLGCVLNKVKKGFGFTYYGLGYGYGYGYYGQAKKTE